MDEKYADSICRSLFSMDGELGVVQDNLEYLIKINDNLETICRYLGDISKAASQFVKIEKQKNRVVK